MKRDVPIVVHGKYSFLPPPPPLLATPLSPATIHNFRVVIFASLEHVVNVIRFTYQPKDLFVRSI